MIDATIVFGTVGAVFGGSLSWSAMSVARSQARASSELGFIRNAKLVFYLVVGVSGVLLWAAGQILRLDDELSKQEMHGYLALPMACFAAAIVAGFVGVLMENSRRKKVTREHAMERARQPEGARSASGPARITKVPQLPKTLRPTASSLFGPAVGACILIAWGVYRLPRSPIGAPLAIGFGGLLVFLCLAIALSGKAYLKIDDQKLIVSSLFSSRTISLRDIVAFEIYAGTRGPRVGWSYRGAASTRMRKLNLRAFGVDDVLSSNYGLSSNQLCDLLNDTLSLSQRKYPKSELA